MMINDNEPIRRGDAIREVMLIVAGSRHVTLADKTVAAIRALPAALDVQPAPDVAEPAPKEHYDDYAVRQFAKLMAEKMAASRAKGRSGWNDPEKCSVDYLRFLLYEHLDKGDPVDVANICMMLRHYDASTYRDHCNCKPAPDVAQIRAKVAQAIFDPGATEGYKGDRSLTDWQVDAVMRALITTPPPPDAMAERVAALVEAAKRLLDRDQINTCQHENTHRGGYLWEICDDCGRKWADDEGGKPEFTPPQEWIDVMAALAAMKGDQPQTDYEQKVASLKEDFPNGI